MKIDLFTLAKKDSYPLIKEVVVYPLKINQDERGILVESLKINWPEVFDAQKRPFTQCYYSITNPGAARDIDRWHYHHQQEDRFVVIKGEMVVALYDWRQDSPTYGSLNLFSMGEPRAEKGQYLLLIPINVLHCFKNIGQKEVVLLNFPTRLYDPAEEKRIAFKEVKLSDASFFDWAQL